MDVLLIRKYIHYTVVNSNDIFLRSPNARQTVLGHVVVSIGKTKTRPMETTNVETKAGLFKVKPLSLLPKKWQFCSGQKKDPLPNSFLFTPDKLYPISPPPPPSHKPSEGKFSPHHPPLSVVYFYQWMGDALPVCWSKYDFAMFFALFNIKMRQKWRKKHYKPLT